MPKKLLPVFFLAVSLVAVGQMDSLRQKLKQHSAQDTARHNVLNALVRAFRVDYPDSAIMYGEQALVLAKKLQSPIRVVQSLNLLGTAHYFKGDFVKAIEWQRAALRQAKNNQVMQELGNVQASLALALQSHSEYSEAIQTYFEALHTEEQNGNMRNVAKVYSNLAILYRNLNDYGNAIQNAKRAIAISKTLPSASYSLLASTSNTIALSLIDLKKYDSAILYLHDALQFNTRSGNVTYQLNSQSNLAYCYTKTGQIDSASKYIIEPLRSIERVSNQYIRASIWLNAGEVALAKRKFTEAEQYATKGVELAKISGNGNPVLQGYQILSEVYQAQRKFESSGKYLKLALLLNDSLKSVEAHQLAANVQRDYEIKSRQQKIDALAHETALQESQLKSEQQLRFYLILILVLLILAGGFAFYSFYTKAKVNRLLEAKNIEIDSKNKLLLSVNQSLRDQALRGQMKPHFIFNALNSIQYLILQNESTKAFDYLSKFSQLLRSALEFSNLHSVELEKEVKWLQLYVNLESLRFNYEFDFSIRYLTDEAQLKRQSIPPFLIQPFLENAIAHGLMPKQGERKLVLEFKSDDERLDIIISDNGIGREQSQSAKNDVQKKRKSFGIDIVKARLEILSGLSGKNIVFNISDGQDEHGAKLGTRVFLSIPIEINFTNQKSMP